MKVPAKEWRTRITAAVLLAGSLGCWSLAAPLAADLLVVEKSVIKADALMILSGSADHEQRAAAGAAEFRRGIAPKILITDDGQRGGWDNKEKGNPFFVERIRRKLIADGVPPEAIEQLPGIVSGTIDEAELAIRSTKERGLRSILIVTSEFHSRRALWAFERVAARQQFDAEIGLSAAASDPNYPRRNTWWLTPRGFRTVAGEYVKFAGYWLFY